MQGGEATQTLIEPTGLCVTWTLGDGARLTLVANLGDQPQSGFAQPEGEIIFANRSGADKELAEGILAAWSVVWSLARRT
jgi:maltooligosyltrehalose trehalohydrolase